jgi:squalene-hopene/tetraprenyl-beta-curcumene cyclase
LWALKPSWKISPEVRVDELFRDPAERAEIFEWDARILSWRTFFLIVDRVMKLHEALPVKPFRRVALRKAKKWVEEHLDRSDGLATIYPAMLNSVLAMNAMGRGWDDPVIVREVAFIKSYEIESANTLRMQPCISPVWDTAIAMVSLEEAGLPANHPALARAAEWLMKNQITSGGDWQIKNRDAAPGGWAFEFRNEFFPDVDDTAFVLMALARAEAPDAAAQQQALQRGVAWMLSMQNRDGGWGAFDRDNNLSLLNHIPFADHNAMLDPSTADVTARAIECLGQMGWTPSEPAVQRAWNFIRNDQCPDGSWYGRWGVNYVYGSSGVLRAMGALRMNHQPEALRSGEWLRQVQNLDGGFGETPASYEDPSLKGKGESTASQTAWGLIGLLAAFGPDDPSVKRAVNYLTQHQRADGTWEEHLFTGTGFPQVFYLQYHLYRNSFPVYALARYRNMVQGTEPCKPKKVTPRDVAHLYQSRGD